jgi:alkaline phosphatase
MRAWPVVAVVRPQGKTSMRLDVPLAGVRFLVSCVVLASWASTAWTADQLHDMQQQADEEKHAEWGHWGKDPSKYSSWTNHSNRLIPVYTFGIDLKAYKDDRSAYRDADKVKALYGYLPQGTVNSRATYMDQTDIYHLQQDAIKAGKKHVILFIVDGMDWQTTQAAAIYRSGKVYTSGRGSGLWFQDYQGVPTDYGCFVSSPHNTGTNVDADAQTVLDSGDAQRGGYDAQIGGATPWAHPQSDEYLLGQFRTRSHGVTDSASSATSMTAGIKTFNAAINVDPEGKQVETIGRQLQQQGYSIGVVTSVPISHATPAAAYANNVSRNDYQDLSRDLVGLPSVSHRQGPLPGVDVLLGAGWGETSDDEKNQGRNFVPGNKYLPDDEIESLDYHNGGKYVVSQRTPGQPGRDVLLNAAREAFAGNHRLFGFFGVGGGHLPYQTGDGGYNPVGEDYSQADVQENPTLADMTRAALGVLSKNKTKGFWLMVESGDVDWANHANNIDSSIGAVLSGDEAFRVITNWVEKKSNWDETAVIVTADHGHFFVLDDPQALIRQPAELATAK